MSATFTQQAVMGLLSPQTDNVTPALGRLGGVGGAVTQTGTPSMAVVVAPAVWVIPGPAPTSQGAFLWTPGTGNQTVTVPASDPTNPRIDILIAQINDPGSTSAAGDASFAIVTGTPAASPSQPVLPTGALYIRTIAVGAGVTSIVNANISGVPATASLRAAVTGPAGYLATATPAADTTGITTTETNINNLASVAVTAGTSRRVEITIDLGMFSSVANDEVRVRVYDGATAIIDKFMTMPNAANRSTPFCSVTNLSGWSGAHTLRVTAVRSTGSGSITVQAARSEGLLVKDIGT